MESDLPVGSLIVTEFIKYEDIEIGDNITFSRENSTALETHRVIGKSDTANKIITQGIVHRTKTDCQGRKLNF